MVLISLSAHIITSYATISVTTMISVKFNIFLVAIKYFVNTQNKYVFNKNNRYLYVYSIWNTPI